MNSRAFTLIELLIVITIIILLSLMTYAPYQFYGNLAKVRLSGERVTQAFQEAKMYSANGYLFPGSNSNASIGLVLERGASSVTLLAFSGNTVSFEPNDNAKLIKTSPLEDHVSISSISGGHDTVLFRLTPPNGDITMYTDTTTPSTSTGVTIRV